MSALRRVDPEERSPNALHVAVAGPEPIVAAVAEERDVTDLPREHPAWVRDAIALSRRARVLVARLRPAVFRVLSFWDHRVRCIAVGDRRLRVDASGSYTIDS
ncbi:MAG TPA: hypothetical protein VGF18_09975 [Candidatus Tumulicola sp.]